MAPEPVMEIARMVRDVRSTVSSPLNESFSAVTRSLSSSLTGVEPARAETSTLPAAVSTASSFTSARTLEYSTATEMPAPTPAYTPAATVPEIISEIRLSQAITWISPAEVTVDAPPIYALTLSFGS